MCYNVLVRSSRFSPVLHAMPVRLVVLRNAPRYSHPSRFISRHCTKPLLFIPLRSLLHSSKTQLLSFQSFPHSLPKATRVGGTHQSLPHYLLASLSRFPQSPACPDLVGVINRCIIPPSEHPAERSRMPGPRLPHREGNHHSRILSAFSEHP